MVVVGDTAHTYDQAAAGWQQQWCWTMHCEQVLLCLVRVRGDTNMQNKRNSYKLQISHCLSLILWLLVSCKIWGRRELVHTLITLFVRPHIGKNACFTSMDVFSTICNIFEKCAFTNTCNCACVCPWSFYKFALVRSEIGLRRSWTLAIIFVNIVIVPHFIVNMCFVLCQN